MGAVGGLMVVVVVGFQAQIDSRQDDALRHVVETMREINQRQDTSAKELSASIEKANERQDEALKDVTDGLVEATKNIAVLSERSNRGAR